MLVTLFNCFVYIFFFKQKTAYEMRISDWSSDVCSSDLFGGDVDAAKDRISITPRDSARARLFIAPAGQWITLEAGKIARATYTPAPGRIELTLDPADTHKIGRAHV